MKKLVMLVGMATFVIMMSMSFPSVVQADTISIQTLLSPMLLTELQSDNMSEQPTEHRSSWGAVKEMYRGINPVQYSAESTASVNRRGTIQPYSIGSSRYFVRNECWYSLNHDWLYRGDDPNGPPNTTSNYNWLSKKYDANANALRFVLGKYGGFVSDLIPGYGGAVDVNYWTDRLSDDKYALAFKGSSSGHGAQCVSFVAMVIYRATGGRYQLNWNWDTMNSGYAPATSAQPGDIVFHTSGIHHVGICVINYGSGITVVDSNSQGNEVIRRHDISNNEINSVGWKVMSGAGRWY